jgi:hypothetical protein
MMEQVAALFESFFDPGLFLPGSSRPMTVFT